MHDLVHIIQYGDISRLMELGVPELKSTLRAEGYKLLDTIEHFMAHYKADDGQFVTGVKQGEATIQLNSDDLQKAVLGYIKCVLWQSPYFAITQPDQYEAVKTAFEKRGLEVRDIEKE